MSLSSAYLNSPRNPQLHCRRGEKSFFSGNGGSAAGCVASWPPELVVRLRTTQRPGSALAFTRIPQCLQPQATITDLNGFFRGQIESLVAAQIFSSRFLRGGNSPNILRGRKQAELAALLLRHLRVRPARPRRQGGLLLNVPSRDPSAFRSAHHMPRRMLAHRALPVVASIVGRSFTSPH